MIRSFPGLALSAPLLAASVLPGEAFAGPPFVTDDPAPTDRGHWEIYNFVSTTHVKGATSGEAGIDVNYGGAQNLQLTLVVPVAYSRTASTLIGTGTVEIAAKYRFVRQNEESWLPDVAIFPRIFAGTARRGLGDGHTSLFVPLWAEKDFGKWSLFGGGGYVVNPGADGRDYWSGGLVLTRAVSDRTTFGVEVFRRTADVREGKAFAGVNVGATVKLIEHWSLLTAFGPGVENARSEGRYGAYVALKADY